MPEHVHLLMSEPKLHPLATTLNVLKAETSKRLKGDRKQFWQTRYYDFNVLTSAKLVEKLRSIHRNPVERGLVPSPEDWPGSSFRHWQTGETSRVEIHSAWKLNRPTHPTSHPYRKLHRGMGGMQELNPPPLPLAIPQEPASVFTRNTLSPTNSSSPSSK